MKKVLAIILALVLALALVACGTAKPDTSAPATESAAPSSAAPDTAAPETSAPAEEGKSPYPNANPDGSINLDTIAHYDQNYDYAQNEKIKCTYIAQDGGPLYQQSAAAYEHWAPLYNMEWAGFISSNGDADLFMTSLQNQLDQGVRAFILDPDTAIMPAVRDLMSQYPEAAWMSQMAAPRDGTTGEGVPPGGNMINPYVGFDNYDAGYQVTKRLIQWKEENLKDVAWSDIGFLCMAFSVSPPLNERVQASEDLWKETTGSTDNFFVADCASTGINLQGGIDAAGPVISTNSDYKYWLVNGLIDDFSQAAASIIDQQGLTENSCVITFGGSGLQMQWDQGQFDSFRYALFTAQNLYAEPIIGSVYAYLQGWATPETIWPSWIKWDDHGGEGHSYPQLRLPTVWLEPETYKHYLEWTDMYAKAEAYDYPQDGISIDDFSPFVDKVPDDFKQP
jgi:ABC-type sugar transport system substrate-binding protein